MAAKAKTNTASSYISKPKVKRPGVHAKTFVLLEMVSMVDLTFTSSF